MLRLIRSGVITTIYLLNSKPDNISFVELPRTRREQLIDEWIVSKIERDIMKRRFCDKVTVETIAEEFDRSVRGINYILKRGLKTIERHI